MADLMQQDRELSSPEDIAFRLRNLAQNMAAGSEPVARDHQAWKRVEELAEAVAALRAAPEGGVPERTLMALATGWRRHAAAGGRGRAVLIQCSESLEAAVIAARPQGVKDAR